MNKEIEHLINDKFTEFKAKFKSNAENIVDKLVKNSAKIEDVINSKIKDKQTQNLFKNALTALQYAQEQEKNNVQEGIGSGFIKKHMSLVLACSFLLQMFIPAVAQAEEPKSYGDEVAEIWAQRQKGKKTSWFCRVPDYNEMTTKQKIAYNTLNALGSVCNKLLISKDKLTQLRKSKIVKTSDTQTQSSDSSVNKSKSIPSNKKIKSGKFGDYVPGHYDSNGKWNPGRYVK